MYDSHRLGEVATPRVKAPKRDRYLGRPTETSATTLGEVVAHDGTLLKLADFTLPHD